VQGKENEIQQQSRPIPDEFIHQEFGKAVLIEKKIFHQFNLPFTAWRSEKLSPVF